VRGDGRREESRREAGGRGREGEGIREVPEFFFHKPVQVVLPTNSKPTRHPHVVLSFSKKAFLSSHAHSLTPGAVGVHVPEQLPLFFSQGLIARKSKFMSVFS
jgi:hypothetical protein